MIPNEIMNNPEIDIYMQSILLVLYRFRNQNNNTCFPSYSVLAKYAKCCVRKAQNSIKQLEKMGLIAVSRHSKNRLHAHASNVYMLPLMKTILEPSQESHHTVIDDRFCHTQISADELVQEMENVWLFENKIANIDDTDNCFSDRQNSNEAIQEIDESFLASSMIQSKEKQAELYRASHARPYAYDAPPCAPQPPIKNYILKTYIQNNLSIILS